MKKSMLGEYITGYSVKNKKDEDIPVYSVTNDRGFCTEYFSKDVSGKDKKNYKIVPRGYFAYNPSRINVGSVDWQNCEDRVIVSPLYVVFKTDERLEQEYLKYYLKSDIGRYYINESAVGAVRANLKLDILSKFRLPIPDIEEQKNIVSQLKLIDEMIELKEKEITVLDTMSKARFVEMFGDPQDNALSWRKMPLSHIIINANNGMARRGNDEDGNIVMRLVELQDGYIDYSNTNRIILNDSEKKKYLLKDKDFLFARVNGNPDNVGRCAVFYDIGEDVYHNDHIIRVHFDETLLNGVFASALFNNAYGKQQLKSKVKTSAGQYTVSQDGIGEIVTILPPIELQNQFADFVHQVDKSKTEAHKAIEKLKILQKNLLQKYFC